MNRLALAAALTGFSGVTLGAFGAHGLGDRLTTESLGWWDTATLYTLVHAIAALTVSRSKDAAKPAGWAFIIGAIIFGGSLYALALGAPRIMGAITPIGGVSFLFGWGMLAWRATRS
ncbi:UNVERIFIED_CONTAM: hypothetical protein GTU68_045915 [Idotea baltica]|nr:hypothetical protein [Idotea baltica]